MGVWRAEGASTSDPWKTPNNEATAQLRCPALSPGSPSISRAARSLTLWPRLSARSPARKQDLKNDEDYDHKKDDRRDEDDLLHRTRRLPAWQRWQSGRKARKADLSLWGASVCVGG